MAVPLALSCSLGSSCSRSPFSVRYWQRRAPLHLPAFRSTRFRSSTGKSDNSVRCGLPTVPGAIIKPLNSFVERVPFLFCCFSVLNFYFRILFPQCRAPPRVAMAAVNDPNSLPSLAIRICPATLSLLGFRLLHTLLRLSRPSTSTTASPPSPAWLLVLAPMSGSNRRAPNHTFNQRSLVLLDSTLSERSGRPRSVPPW
jgi:hypothetical protein